MEFWCSMPDCCLQLFRSHLELLLCAMRNKCYTSNKQLFVQPVYLFSFDRVRKPRMISKTGCDKSDNEIMVRWWRMEEEMRVVAIPMRSSFRFRVAR